MDDTVNHLAAKVQRTEHRDPLHYLFQTRTFPQVVFLTIRLNIFNSLKIKIKRLQNHCELNGSSPSSLSGLNFLCFCMAEIRQLIHLERKTHVCTYFLVSFDFNQNKMICERVQLQDHNNLPAGGSAG